MCSNFGQTWGQVWTHFGTSKTCRQTPPPGHPKTGCPEGYFRRLPNRLPTRSIRTPQTGVSGGGGWGVQFEVRRTGRSGHRFGEHVLRARGQAWSSLMSRHQRREHQGGKVRILRTLDASGGRTQLRLGEQQDDTSCVCFVPVLRTRLQLA